MKKQRKKNTREQRSTRYAAAGQHVTSITIRGGDIVRYRERSSGNTEFKDRGVRDRREKSARATARLMKFATRAGPIYGTRVLVNFPIESVSSFPNRLAAAPRAPAIATKRGPSGPECARLSLFLRQTKRRNGAGHARPALEIAIF